jgi:branched-subunit amino acid transport protein
VSLVMTLVLAGLLTYATRLSFIVLVGRVETPPLFVRALRFVPAAVLSALILPELVTRGGELKFDLSNPRLIAGVLAALVAYRTRSVLVTIAAGMVSLWILQVLLPR